MLGRIADFSYVKGINNVKIGAVYAQTFLREHDNLAVVASTFNSPCVDADGNPLSGFTDPSQCAAAATRPIQTFCRCFCRMT